MSMQIDFSEACTHTFSANEIRQYSECARKRYYSSRDHLAIRSTKPSGALILGKRVHEMLEHYYMNGQTRLNELMNEGKPLTRELAEDALGDIEPFQLTEEQKAELGYDISTFNCIHENCRVRIVDDLVKYEIIACEWEFRLTNWPVDDVMYHGQIDMIVRERATNKIWFFEHKTSKDFRPEIYNRFDIQLHIYTKYGKIFANMHDCLWGGMILNEFKKAKTSRGYAEHRMYYTYSDEEMEEFTAWLYKKTAAAISAQNRHEPCNTYMTCKTCEYAPICLKLGYAAPKTREEILEDESYVDSETGEQLYRYDPRDKEEDHE